ncbi:MAG: tripartite tricarboxylate transporter substrate-binding protein, partial [Caldimonas sp.]
TPEIPTMKEAGLPEIENMAWMAVMAPASTPNEIVERMNQEINAALALPEVREKLASLFMEPVGGTSEALRSFMKQELTVMTPIIKRSGTTAE